MWDKIKKRYTIIFFGVILLMFILLLLFGRFIENPIYKFATGFFGLLIITAVLVIIDEVMRKKKNKKFEEQNHKNFKINGIYTKIINEVDINKILQQKLLLDLIFLFFIFVAIGSNILALLNQLNREITNVIVPIWIFSLIMIIVLVSKYKSMGTNIYKALIPEILKNCKMQTYFSDGKAIKEISENAYINSPINTEIYNRFESMYAIKQAINHNEITGYDIKVDWKSLLQRSTIPIFDGLLFEMDLKNIEMLGAQINMCTKFKKQKSYTDKFFVEENFKEEKIEDILEIEMNNKIVYEQIVTPEILKLIETFYNKYKVEFKIMIYEEKIYFVFPSDKIIRYLPLKNLLSKTQLLIYLETLKFLEEFINISPIFQYKD